MHGGGLGLEELAAELFLAGGEGPRVLFPRDGAVFFRDSVSAEARQGIPAWIVASREEVLGVRLNGSALSLRYPFRLELPVKPGTYRLEVTGCSGGEAISYTVR